MTDQEILSLLKEIDEGFITSVVKEEELSLIDNITWKEIKKVPESIGNLTAFRALT